MFTDFLNRAPMETLLLEQARRLYPPAEDRQAWDGIPPAGREEIRKLAAEWAAARYGEDAGE